MKLIVDRKYPKENYTIGKLYMEVNGQRVYICDTLEDTVRDLNKNGVFDNGEQKIMHKTAIPYATYKIDMNTISPKFSQYPFYMNTCKGKLPRLVNVNSFEGVLIHCAEGYKGAELLSGCIGVGKNTIKGGLTGSKEAFAMVYLLLLYAHSKGEQNTITII